MSPRSGLASVIPLILAGSATAASLYSPIRRQESAPVAFASLNFTNVADPTDPYNFSVVDLMGDDQVIYVANITVDGVSYEVQLDTGSSDLWLNTQNITLSPAANDTNITVTITYDDNSTASGDVFLAPAQFGNFSIPSQAFINAPGSNATSDNDLGLMGLSSANLSEVYTTLSNTSFDGKPVLYNIFSAYTNISNFMTFLLSRSNLGITDGGIFTIGDVDPNWSAVLNQTQIPVIAALQQWIGLTDGIIVNGKAFTGHGLLSNIERAPKDVKEKTLSLLDTGTSTGTLPPFYWDAVYRDVPGIQVVNESAGVFSMPCNTKLNVSVVFNGTEYPINPLDLTRVSTTGSFSNGTNQTICVNTFLPMDLSSQGVDIILGDSFMRNVYALFNFGNWTNPSEKPPYMQLLSTTNQSAAWEQFDDLNNARIQQWNELMGQFNVTNSTNGGSATRKRKAYKRSPLQVARDVDVSEEALNTYSYWYNN